MEKCKFDLAWRGPCNKPADDSGYCEEHTKVTCTSCGEKATRQCDMTFQLVCGFPLCDDCGHYDEENKYKHCKKKE